MHRGYGRRFRPLSGRRLPVRELMPLGGDRSVFIGGSVSIRSHPFQERRYAVRLEEIARASKYPYETEEALFGYLDTLTGTSIMADKTVDVDLTTVQEETSKLESLRNGRFLSRRQFALELEGRILLGCDP